MFFAEVFKDYLCVGAKTSSSKSWGCTKMSAAEEGDW